MSLSRLRNNIKDITSAYEACQHVNGKYHVHTFEEDSDGMLIPIVKEKCSFCKRTLATYDAEVYSWAS